MKLLEFAVMVALWGTVAYQAHGLLHKDPGALDANITQVAEYINHARNEQ